ncbi:MAG TPA: alpha-E domain-containing protein [Longimicrobiales bacterium]|nr:alpha-E domain-containing protein [Longimicrobiales bacterium]
MISRVAESCYWLMRYVERCDTVSRLLRVHSGMVLDAVLPSDRAWRPLLIVEGEGPRFEQRFGRRAGGDGEIVQDYLTWDREAPVSILSSLRFARENARTIRETISLEMWNSINAFWLWMCADDARKLFDDDRQAFYEEVSNRCHTFQGICHNTMLHEEPFDFMRLGLNLERAGQTARILDLQHHALGGRPRLPAEAVGAVEWIAILRTCSAYEPFFKKVRAPLAGPAVAEFLLLEPAFPGSVLHGVTRAQNFLRRIRPLDAASVGRRSASLLEDLHGYVVTLDLGQALEDGMHGVLTRIVDCCAETSRAIGRDYFYAADEDVGAEVGGAEEIPERVLDA